MHHSAHILRTIAYLYKSYSGLSTMPKRYLLLVVNCYNALEEDQLDREIEQLVMLILEEPTTTAPAFTPVVQIMAPNPACAPHATMMSFSVSKAELESRDGLNVWAPVYLFEWSTFDPTDRDVLIFSFN